MMGPPIGFLGFWGYDLFRLRDSGLAIKFRGIQDSNRVHGMQYRTKTILRDMENDLIFSRDTGSTLPDRSPQISEVHKKQRTLNIYTHDLFVFEIMFIHKNLYYLTRRLPEEDSQLHIQ